MILSRSLAILSLLLLAGGALQAQTLGSLWFVQAGGGVGAHDNGPFSRRLQSYTPRQNNGERFVYRTEEFANVGYSIGAAAGFMMDSGLLLGASGETVMFPIVESINGLGNERDEYTLSGWEGGLDIGWTLLNEDATIVYPFLHFAYAGYALDYANHQTDSIPFFEGNAVPAGTTATYTGAAPRFAIGVGMNSIVGGTLGGFLVGARLSYGRMISAPEWEQEGEVVNNGGHTPYYNSLTLSVAIGFGGGTR
jgi:hypothetical protein